MMGTSRQGFWYDGMFDLPVIGAVGLNVALDIRRRHDLYIWRRPFVTSLVNRAAINRPRQSHRLHINLQRISHPHTDSHTVDEMGGLLHTVVCFHIGFASPLAMLWTGYPWTNFKLLPLLLQVSMLPTKLSLTTPNIAAKASISGIKATKTHRPSVLCWNQ